MIFPTTGLYEELFSNFEFCLYKASESISLLNTMFLERVLVQLLKEI